MSGLDLFQHRFVPGDPSLPCLLLLHGTGGDEESLLPLAASLVPGWALLSPRGNVSEGGANRFFRRFAEGVFDVEDIRKQAKDLSSFLGSAAREHGLDLSRTYAMGYSNGANIASSLMLLHPESLGGAVLARAMVPLQPEPVPDLAGKELLILQGARDPLEPPGETDRLRRLLEEAGALVEVQLAPAGHELTRADVDAARRWLVARAEK